MTEYLLGIFGTVAVLGLSSLIAYDGGDGAMRFALAVLLLYSVTIPAAKLVAAGDMEFPSFDYSEGEATGDYASVAEGAFREGVRSAVSSEFSLPDDNVRVLIEDFDFEGMCAGRIRIILSGRAALADYKKIEDYIESLGLGECEVEIEIG